MVRHFIWSKLASAGKIQDTMLKTRMPEGVLLTSVPNVQRKIYASFISWVVAAISKKLRNYSSSLVDVFHNGNISKNIRKLKLSTVYYKDRRCVIIRWQTDPLASLYSWEKRSLEAKPLYLQVLLLLMIIRSWRGVR